MEEADRPRIEPVEKPSADTGPEPRDFRAELERLASRVPEDVRKVLTEELRGEFREVRTNPRRSR